MEAPNRKRAKVTIREARKDEVPEIIRLAEKELPDELNEEERSQLEEVRKALALRLHELLTHRGNEFYVAEVEGSPGMAGYVWFGISQRPFSGLKVGWIFDVQVLPAHRGKGIGEALMRHALEVSRKRGFGETGLMVRANNRTAFSLYEKLGFQPEHILMTKRDAGPVSHSNS